MSLLGANNSDLFIIFAEYLLMASHGWILICQNSPFVIGFTFEVQSFTSGMVSFSLKPSLNLNLLNLGIRLITKRPHED